MPTHHYTHITASPLYTNPTHAIERLSRSSWQITSPLLSASIPAKSYAEAKQLASEIDFNALSVKRAEPEAVATVEAILTEVNPFDVILTEAATIQDLGTMQGAYDQAVRECDLCAVFGHLQFRAPTNEALEAVNAARTKVPDYARAVELAGLISSGALLERIATEAQEYADGVENHGSSVLLSYLIMALCDLPDGGVKTALIRWACAFDQYDGGWPARLRLEGAALRHARVTDWMAECERIDRREWVAQEVRKVEDGGRADMGGDRAREWGEVWYLARNEDECAAEVVMSEVGGRMPSLLSPEPEHWIPLQDGRVLIVNWRAASLGEVVSAAVWVDDGGLSLMGWYVLGSGWLSIDRLREEDVDSEALGVILEAIARAGLATIA